MEPTTERVDVLGEPRRPLVILGSGGHGRELLDIVEALGARERFVGFLDDTSPSGEHLSRLEARGTTVLGTVDWLGGHDADLIIGIGTSSVRRRLHSTIAASAPQTRFPTLIHPSAQVGSENRFDIGVVICSGTTVTTNVEIGQHSHINVGCAVQHDSRIGRFTTLSPGVFINGDVTVGDDVFMGTGAVITRGCTIGSGAVVGAGAVVLSDVAPGETVVGIPASPRARN